MKIFVTLLATFILLSGCSKPSPQKPLPAPPRYSESNRQDAVVVTRVVEFVQVKGKNCFKKVVTFRVEILPETVVCSQDGSCPTPPEAPIGTGSTFAAAMNSFFSKYDPGLIK